MHSTHTAQRCDPVCAAAAVVIHPRLLAVALASALWGLPAAATASGSGAAADFDIDSLRARGLDPALASFFREAPRFSAGERRVGLVINGQPLGSVDARFGSDGQLRIDGAFLRQAGLRIPSSTFLVDPPESDLYDYAAAWPQAIIKLDPGQERVELIVPEAALDDRPGAVREFSRGGGAALLNYDVNSSLLRGHGGSQRFTSASTELGFNLGDWIVRSRQAYSAGHRRSQFNQLDVYAQRSSVDLKQVLQIGEINVSAPLFGGASITGLQVIPEEALRQPDTTMAVIEGIADSEARVEIHQLGILLHSTVVPPGPFSINDFRPLNQNADITVTVHEQGGTRSFVVPAASFRRANLSVPGSTFAAGQLRTFGDRSDQQGEMIAMLTTAWRPKRTDIVLSAGVLMAPSYQSVAAGIDSSIGGASLFSGRATWAVDRMGGARGVDLETRFSTTLADRFSVNATFNQRTAGFRELGERTYPSDAQGLYARSHRQLGVGAGWSSHRLGSFSASYAARQTAAGDVTSQMSAAWSRRIGPASVSLNLAREGRRQGRRDGMATYLNVSVPLGRTQLRSTVRQRDGNTQVGVGMSDRLGAGVSYRAQLDHSLERGSSAFSAGINAVPRYTEVGLSYYQSDASTTVSGRISGGLVAHRGGLTLSPYAVQDTFAVVKAGDQAGTRLTTPAGTVWTDARGHAVVPRLMPYANNRVDVATASLPRRYDLLNGSQVLQAGRGSVNHLEFGITSTRRLLVSIVDAHGAPLSKGASVLAGDALVASVADRGRAFISDFKPDQPLTISLPNDTRCAVTLNMQHEQHQDRFYEEASAICDAR